MAAVAILDLLRKNPNFGGQTFTSRTLFSPKIVGASTFAFATPFAVGAAIFRNGATQIAYCDAATTVDEDYFSSIKSTSENIFGNGNNVFNYSAKRYDIPVKPLFSAFHWKTLALTSLRSFVLYFSPLLEKRPRSDDEDDDFLQDDPEENHVDLVVPFKKSVKHILRETSVVTTRRVLERLAVHYVSQRMAWKLLKDIPKSAVRKAERGMPTSAYIFCVSRTTFRGHLLGILASWVVQVGIDAYHFFKFITKKDNKDEAEVVEQIRLLGKKVYDATVRCASSLVFASIGAGIGAALIRPSTGQWIGCAVGDLAGPSIVALCFGNMNAEI